MSVETKFAEIGARVKVRPGRDWSTFRFRGAAMQPRVRPSIDIRSDRKGEFFDVVLPGTVELSVLDASKDSRHLVLMSKDVSGTKSRYLCGHDERHWFVAAVPESYPATTIHEAKMALLPREFRTDAAPRLRKDRREARKNEMWRRQGEWFFVPAPDFEPMDSDIILHNEPLRRNRRSKPHVVAEAVRSGGETRYQADRAPLRRGGVYQPRIDEIQKALSGRTLTASEKAVMEARFPEVSWRSVLVNPTMYVRGPVRHSDHSTLVLNGWHRVVMNSENLAVASSSVMFID